LRGGRVAHDALSLVVEQDNSPGELIRLLVERAVVRADGVEARAAECGLFCGGDVGFAAHFCF